MDVGGRGGEGASPVAGLLPAEDLGLGGPHGVVGEGLVAVLHGEEVAEGAAKVGVGLADEASLNVRWAIERRVESIYNSETAELN